MKKFYKVTGIIAGICFAIGLVLAIVGVAMGAKGVIALTKEHGFQILENVDKWNYKDMDMNAFDSVCIEAKSADINIVPSKDGKYGVDISLMGDESTIDFTNEDGVLSIKEDGSNLGFVISLFSWESSYDNVITVYVPEDVLFNKVDITCNAGDIDIEDVCGIENLKIVADAGDIDVNVALCENVDIDVNAGDVTLENIQVNTSLNVMMDIGDLDVSGHISSNVNIEVNVGDIDLDTGMTSSDFCYDVSSDVGDIEVFGREYDGIGNNISSKNEAEYTMHVTSNVGDITVE